VRRCGGGITGAIVAIIGTVSITGIMCGTITAATTTSSTSGT
jgi:hypothetical protein